VYFTAWKDGRDVLAYVPAPGGETEFISRRAIGTDTYACIRGISPDGQQLTVVTGKQATSISGFHLWLVTTSGQGARPVCDIIANDADWSPDGRQMAYATGNQIWIAENDFRNRRKLVEHEGLASYPRWSPDGRRIRFTSMAWETYQKTIWE